RDHRAATHTRRSHPAAVRHAEHPSCSTPRTEVSHDSPAESSNQGHWPKLIPLPPDRDLISGARHRSTIDLDSTRPMTALGAAPSVTSFDELHQERALGHEFARVLARNGEVADHVDDAVRAGRDAIGTARRTHPIESQGPSMAEVAVVAREHRL